MMPEAMTFLVIALVNAFIINGIHLSTYEGMINAWIPRLLKNTPEWVQKPLYDCPTCMASVHSTYIFWAAYPFTLESLILYPFYILALAAMATVINRAYDE
jgi:hypothetical protein